MFMKKILITGGFGFLGTHLTELLLKKKTNQVHVVDSMTTSPIQLKYYLKKIGNPKNLTYSLIPMDRYFKKKTLPKFQEIYHLASPVGPAGVLNHAGNMVRQIIGDTYILMDYCSKNKIKLLDVSTSEIYGGGQKGYCSEEMPKIVPPQTTVRLEYAMAKLAAEIAIINSCAIGKLKASIVRPFNVAGPHQSPKGGFVLPRFLQQAHAGKPLTVFGTGRAIRAFTHVKDMVNGIVLTMNKGRNGEVYNIGNPDNKINIKALAKSVIRIVESKSKIISTDPKKLYGRLFEEANDKFPNASKAFKELGWRPKYDMDTIIQDAYEDYLEQLQSKKLLTDITREQVRK